MTIDFWFWLLGEFALGVIALVVIDYLDAKRQQRSREEDEHARRARIAARAAEGARDRGLEAITASRGFAAVMLEPTHKGEPTMKGMSLVAAFALTVVACSSPVFPTPTEAKELKKTETNAPAPAPTPDPVADPTPAPPAEGTITLHVVDTANGKAIVHAEVTVDGTFLGHTDAAGTYALHVTYGRRFTLTVYHGQYDSPKHQAVTFTAKDTDYTVRLTRISPF